MSRGCKRIYGHSDDREPVKDFLLSQEGDILIDVGANIGFYALNLSRNFKKIYAYEPNHGCCSFITKVCEQDEIKNVEVRCIAIGDYKGENVFYLSPRGDKCHSLLPVGNREVRVQVTTLSDEFPDTKISLVKVDVEGSEFEVLRGAEKIMRNVDAWLVEVHNLEEICGDYATVKGSFEDRCKDMEELLQSYGYKTKWITDKNVIYAWRN